MVSATLILPLVTALLVLAVRSRRQARKVALSGALVTLACAATLVLRIATNTSEVESVRFVEHHAWLPSLGVSYKVGVDGVSALLVLSTSVLVSVCILGPCRSISRRIRPFLALVLTLESALLGVFVSLDVVLLYAFSETALLATCCLLALWAGPEAGRAATRLLIPATLASVLVLAALLAVQVHATSNGAMPTFELAALRERLEARPLSRSIQVLCLLAFIFSLAVRAPLPPFHTWLSRVLSATPAAAAVLLSGGLGVAGYTFLRVAMPLFPEGAALLAPWLGVLAVAAILWGALLGAAERCLQGLAACFCISSAGLMLLGLVAFAPEDGYSREGATGSILLLFHRGLAAGALFLLADSVRRKYPTSDVLHWGPRFKSLLLLTVLSAAGIPGLGGFVGEVLVLRGVVARSAITVALTCAGLVLLAVCLLLRYGRSARGGNRVAPPVASVRAVDLDRRELASLAPLVCLMVVLGLCGGFFADLIEPSVETWLGQVMP